MRAWWIRIVVVVLAEASLAGAQSREGERGAHVFDVRYSERYFGAGVARLSARPTDQQSYRSGWEFRVGDALRWTPSPFVLEGSYGASLRVLPDIVAGSVGQSSGLAGVQLGPVEMKAGVGVSLINLIVRDGGLDFGAFWPRAQVALGVGIGPVRVEAVAHVEYWWCWSGPDVYARGLGLMLSFQMPGFPSGPESSDHGGNGTASELPR